MRVVCCMCVVCVVCVLCVYSYLLWVEAVCGQGGVGGAGLGDHDPHTVDVEQERGQIFRHGYTLVQILEGLEVVWSSGG